MQPTLTNTAVTPTNEFTETFHIRRRVNVRNNEGVEKSRAVIEWTLLRFFFLLLQHRLL